MALTKAPEPKGYEMFGPKPKFPDIPYDEFKTRIDKARELMQAEKIDLLMLWSRQNCRYFTGFTSFHWYAPSIQPLVALIPKDNDPVLVSGDFFRWTVEAQTWIRDIRCQSTCHETQAERALPREVGELAKELGYHKANIALEMGELGCTWIPRPYNDIKTLMDSLPQAKFVDGDRVIWGCRMFKSPMEIERMRKAAAINRQGYSTVAEEYRPGMSEEDVGKIVWRTWTDLGADFVADGHIACGVDKEGIFDTGFHFDGVTTNSGDYLWLDLGLTYKGYWADQGRVLNIGPPTEQYIEENRKCWQVWEAGLEAAKPGVKAKDLWNAVTEAYKEFNLPSPEMCGHGIGQDVHEPPVLSATEEMVLQPGMTLELETGIITAFRRDGGGGAHHVENLLIITEEGAEAVMGLPRGIMNTRYPTK